MGVWVACICQSSCFRTRECLLLQTGTPLLKRTRVCLRSWVRIGAVALSGLAASRRPDLSVAQPFPTPSGGVLPCLQAVLHPCSSHRIWGTTPPSDFPFIWCFSFISAASPEGLGWRQREEGVMSPAPLLGLCWPEGEL